jgi:hypothetical protein
LGSSSVKTVLLAKIEPFWRQPLNSRCAVLSWLRHYEHFGQYSISYVAALFKEPHFLAEVAEMAEAAKTRNTSTDNVRIELYYAPSAGRSGLQIVCHVRNDRNGLVHMLIETFQRDTGDQASFGMSFA